MADGSERGVPVLVPWLQTKMNLLLQLKRINGCTECGGLGVLKPGQNSTLVNCPKCKAVPNQDQFQLGYLLVNDLMELAREAAEEVVRLKFDLKKGTTCALLIISAPKDQMTRLNTIFYDTLRGLERYGSWSLYGAQTPAKYQTGKLPLLVVFDLLNGIEKASLTDQVKVEVKSVGGLFKNHLKLARS